MDENWRRPILFEGVELPDVCIAIDHLGLHDNLPEMSEATSEWLWRFTVCVGRSRTAESAVILHHCSEALRLTEQFRSRLVTTVPEHFQGQFDPVVIDQWIGALKTIIEIASTRSECSWEAPLRPGDSQFGRSLSDVNNEMLAKMDKCFQHAQRKPWWKRLWS